MRIKPINTPRKIAIFCTILSIIILNLGLNVDFSIASEGVCEQTEIKVYPDGSSKVVCVTKDSAGDLHKSGSQQSKQCHFMSAIYGDSGPVVPCRNENGVFNGWGQYCKTADMQPSFDSPLWEGHTYGVIVYCSQSSLMNDQAHFYDWRPTAPEGGIDPEAAARRAVASLHLQTGDIMTAPPSEQMKAGANVPYGYPIWVWLQRADNATGPITHTATVGGLSVSLTAQLKRSDWELRTGGMNNGALLVAQMSCEGDNAAGTPFDPSYQGENENLHESPTCGFPNDSYSKAGRYSLTGKSVWEVTWTAGAASGSFTQTTPPKTVTLDITEYQALVDNVDPD